MFKRNCPKCNEEISYNHSSNYSSAKKKNTLCKACRAKQIGLKQKGKNNPFYGKRHSKDMKQKLSKIALERDQTKYRTEEFKKKISIATSGKLNGNFGKSNYERWLEKYGLEEANKRLEICSVKHSLNNSGSNNPMYGKPSPQGSGNGWSGWYKEFYFRSLRELAFLIELNDMGMVFESAEAKQYAIPYKDWKGQRRNYFADFLVEGNRLVDIKPKKLWDSDSVQRKADAAKFFCKEKEWNYELIDPVIVYECIRAKLAEGEIQFLPKYLLKFQEWEKKNVG